MSRRHKPAGLAARCTALETAVQVGGSRLVPADLTRAETVIRKVGERSALGSGFTVVALAGATGSGKSSVFNALVGAQVATEGVRRPTTSTATAAMWGPEPATELLDWLAVGDRHRVTERSSPRDGLVVLDLPDFDSREARNRAEADRVLELADVLVWVTDPQKYADAVIHESYIRRMSVRDAKTIVLLNQADRLTPQEVEQCVSDLRRLLTADGVVDPLVLPTSARTGAGIDVLLGLVTDIVQSRAAAEARLLSDVRGSAEQLRRAVADDEALLGTDADARLVDALAKAAGVPVVLDAVARDYRTRATARAGWPFTKWTRRLRPDPLRRLGLDRARPQDQRAIEDLTVALGRSSLPAATPAQRSAVDLATRDLADRAATGLPERWAQAVESAAVPDRQRLADRLDQAILGMSLRFRAPAWWSVAAVLQWTFALLAVIGLGWLLTLIALGWLQIDTETPTWGPLPYPVILLAGGLLLGLVTTAVVKWLAAVGAGRRRARVRGRLRETIAEVAAEHILAPVRQVLEDHRRTREALDLAYRP